MARFDFANALFHFFIVFSRRPLSILWLAFWAIAIYVIVFAAMIGIFWPFIDLVLEAERKGVDPDEQEVLAMLGSILLGGSFAVIGSILVAVSIQGAWLRLLAKDEVKSIIPLRLGGDELRLFVVNIAFVLFWIAGGLGVAIIFTLSNLSFELFGDGGIGAVVSALGNTVLVAALIAITFILILRFAAAPALTVLRGRIDIFGGFAASKGILGWMFLTYIVAIVLFLFIAIVIGVFQQVIILIGAADLIPAFAALEEIEDPDLILNELGEIVGSGTFIVAIGAYVILQLMVQMIYEGLWHGIGAYIARRHEGLEGETEDDLETPAASVGDAPSEG